MARPNYHTDSTYAKIKEIAAKLASAKGAKSDN